MAKAIPALVKLIINRYLVDGESIEAIAKDIGYSHGHVHNLLVAYGVQRRKQSRRLRTLNPPSDEEIVERYTAGQTIERIADDNRLSRGYVRDRLLAANVPVRQSGQSLPHNQPAITDQEIVQRYTAGQTIRQLAADGRVSTTYVRDRLLHAHVQIRRPGPRPSSTGRPAPDKWAGPADSPVKGRTQ